MSETDTKTDYFGDSMVFVESYGSSLPKSENIPKAPTHNGVSGITHDGSMYCVDCAKEMGLIEIINGEIFAIVDGETIKPRNAPWTGVTLPSYETDTIYHCGRHENCINSLSGDKHPYNHEHSVGIGIQEKAIQH